MSSGGKERTRVVREGHHDDGAGGGPWSWWWGNSDCIRNEGMSRPPIQSRVRRQGLSDNERDCLVQARSNTLEREGTGFVLGKSCLEKEKRLRRESIWDKSVTTSMFYHARPRDAENIGLLISIYKNELTYWLSGIISTECTVDVLCWSSFLGCLPAIFSTILQGDVMMGESKGSWLLVYEYSWPDILDWHVYLSCVVSRDRHYYDSKRRGHIPRQEKKIQQPAPNFISVRVNRMLGIEVRTPWKGKGFLNFVCFISSSITLLSIFLPSPISRFEKARRMCLDWKSLRVFDKLCTGNLCRSQLSSLTRGSCRHIGSRPMSKLPTMISS